jgi:hypothetical protein
LRRIGVVRRKGEDQALDASEGVQYRALGAELVEGSLEYEHQEIDARKRVGHERSGTAPVYAPHVLALP